MDEPIVASFDCGMVTTLSALAAVALSPQKTAQQVRRNRPVRDNFHTTQQLSDRGRRRARLAGALLNREWLTRFA
jgi:hypothetical protein